jgi:hypothetical protein
VQKSERMQIIDRTKHLNCDSKRRGRP